MRSAVVLGGSGFIGSACVAALRAAGWDARPEPAPRLKTSARSVPQVRVDLAGRQVAIAALAEVLSSSDVVVNAGGMPATTAADSDELFGANALLPGVVAHAMRRSGVPRFIHLSSISVQGRMDPLDETMEHRVSSPYSTSRSLGEWAIQRCSHAVILRLPSVHGPSRSGTRRLYRIANSPLNSTAGHGDRPTPLALLENVGAAVEFLAGYNGELPKVVLQPTEGITTGRLLELLGGREPRHIPVALAQTVTALLRVAGRRSASIQTLGRGIELLWLGQAQKQSWLTGTGFVSPVGAEGWVDVRREIRSR